MTVQTVEQKPVPCAPNVDVRASELCAQWASVDASRQSARAAEQASEFAFVSLLIGFATLIAAFIAAWQTKRTADAAVKQANDAKAELDIQRRHTERQIELIASDQRPALKVSNTSYRLTETERFVFRSRLQVEGKTDARDLRWRIKVRVSDLDSGSQVLSATEYRAIGHLGSGGVAELEGACPLAWKPLRADGSDSWFALEITLIVGWTDASGFPMASAWRKEGSCYPGNSHDEPMNFLGSFVQDPVAQ